MEAFVCADMIDNAQDHFVMVRQANTDSKNRKPMHKIRSTIKWINYPIVGLSGRLLNSSFFCYESSLG
jgi:hypothetical protein